MFEPTSFKHTINDYNLLLDTDSYKAGHWLQYPPNTTQVFSYIESRGGKYDETVFFGLQYYLMEFLSRPITQENIDEAKALWPVHGEPFNEEGWQYILDTYDGFLPIVVNAIPEGTVVPTGNYLCSITNTDPKCYWLPSHLETGLLRAVWYGTTVATQSYTIKQIIKKYLTATATKDVLDSLEFRLHDFGARGVSSYESSGLGSMAHLVNFKGTDTIQGVRQARKYYGEHIAGFSVPASEHSSMTTWGRDGEVKAYENMIDQFGKPNQVVSIVVDSYDTMNAIKNLLGKQLKYKIEESGMNLVVRPDSGVPEDIVLEVVELMAEAFGYTTNNKGYKVLGAGTRVLQGDGIDQYSIVEILENLMQHGWSAENVFFGMGGALLQGVNRDTLKFAMKASAACIDGEWVDVYKDPITDSGKRSKKGVIDLYRRKDTKVYVTGRVSDTTDMKLMESVSRPVFKNGLLLIEDDLTSIRKRTTKK
jgi:nicotinamide phosphoribosyltransferase